jgi:hypothetical protein
VADPPSVEASSSGPQASASSSSSTYPRSDARSAPSRVLIQARIDSSFISCTPAITLNVKCLKPALTLSLSGSLLDPVSSFKDLLHQTRPDTIPPASHQRLLVKGKALADGVLLREYALEEGAGLVLMLKPGYVKPSDDAPASTAAGASRIPTEPAPADPTSPSAVPTLTLSSDPSSPSTSSALPPSAFSTPTTLPPSEAHYHQIIADPTFWTALDSFLKARFGEVADAERFFELVLLGQKRYLKEGEVAKIRDETGITAMGGGLP